METSSRRELFFLCSGWRKENSEDGKPILTLLPVRDKCVVTAKFSQIGAGAGASFPNSSREELIAGFCKYREFVGIKVCWALCFFNFCPVILFDAGRIPGQ